MKKLLTITGKEIKAYFGSPVAYIVLAVFLLLTGWLYWGSFFLIGEASMRNFFSLLPLMLTIFAPAVTMRLMAEEHKSGSIELLTTMPLSDWQIIGGKFLAAVILLSIGLAFTLPYSLSIATVGVIDFGPVITGYLGSFCLIMALCGVGLLASTGCSNQISALILALALGFSLYIIGPLSFFMPEQMASFFNYLCIESHYENFTKGVIDTRDLVYFLSVAALSLYLAVYSLNARRNS